MPPPDDTSGGDQRTVGILGGMAAPSTETYYSRLNAGVNDALGGHHAAHVVVNSVDFAEIERRIHAEQWDEAGEFLAGEARALEAAGADFVVMATNTMHRVAPAITDALSVPFVHILDVTAEAIRDAGVESVGLLGTAATMEADFARDRLAAHGLSALVPDADDRAELDRIIFEELTKSVVREDARETFREVITDLVDRGAGGIVLGCTELELVVDGADAPGATLFDTTALHVERAVELAVNPDRPIER